MSARELIALGTASQAPTRHRNHNGYALRWDGRMLFFDPGEGFQRQCTIAGIAIARADAVCLTHFHGDHCLGVPGLIARWGADRPDTELTIFYPGSGQEYLDRLRTCVAAGTEPLIRPVAATAASDRLETIGEVGALEVRVAALDHRIPAQGYRISEPPTRRFLPDRLADLGIAGPAVGRLERDGCISVGGRAVTIEEVTVVVPGVSFAFVMDTRPCPGSRLLADGVDVLVCESTFLDTERHLAERYAHMTAADAGRLAAASGARLLVLTHFSARYPDTAPFVEEAGRHHADVLALEDFDRVPFPSR